MASLKQFMYVCNSYHYIIKLYLKTCLYTNNHNLCYALIINDNMDAFTANTPYFLCSSQKFLNLESLNLH